MRISVFPVILSSMLGTLLCFSGVTWAFTSLPPPHFGVLHQGGSETFTLCKRQQQQQQYHQQELHHRDERKRIVHHPRSLGIFGMSTTMSPQTSFFDASKDTSSSSSPSLPNQQQQIFKIQNEKEHAAFLESHSNKLLVLKYFSPVCKACQALNPKFTKLAREFSSSGDVVFAEMSLWGNKDYFTNLGIDSLPTTQIYVGSDLMDTLSCRPRQFDSILKRKLRYWTRRMDNTVTRALEAALGGSANNNNQAQQQQSLPFLGSLSVQEEHHDTDYYDPDGEIELQPSDLFDWGDDGEE